MVVASTGPRSARPPTGLPNALTCQALVVKIGAPEGHLNSSERDVTVHAWGGGDLAARDELVVVVHQELRRRAAARLRREQPGHILQPTVLVHEAYLRPSTCSIWTRRSPSSRHSIRARGEWWS